jgi:hypothetical protein
MRAGDGGDGTRTAIGAGRWEVGRTVFLGGGDGLAIAGAGVTVAGGGAGVAGCAAAQAPSTSVVPSAAAADARREIFMMSSWKWAGRVQPGCP